MIKLASIFCIALVVEVGVARGEIPINSGSIQRESEQFIPNAEVSLRSDIQYLASEELRGRSVADDTIDVAADYISGRMSGVGLDTTMIDGTAFQPVSIPIAVQAGEASQNYVKFEFASNDASNAELDQQKSNIIAADLDRDMMPMTVGSATGDVQAPLAFVGYGITAPEFQYDDYAGIDVSGHVVIVLRKEPQASDPDGRFNGVKHTRHAFFATKMQQAMKRGAVAVIFVSDAESTRREVQQIQTRIDGELSRKKRLNDQLQTLPTEAINTRAALLDKIATIDSIVGGMEIKRSAAQSGVMEISTAGSPAKGKNIPAISVSRTLISDLLQQTANNTQARTLVEFESDIDSTFTPQSQILDGVTASVSVSIEPSSRVSNNVIGVLEGRGNLADETVIVGAHYDHVGMGGVGSLAPGTIAIHNGADDNASGTAAMLAAAANIKTKLADVTDHRRVMFIAFTGEERGLLGSKFYVRNPRFPLENTVAMINLDMVGRLRDNELTVYGTGSANTMDDIVERANASLADNGGAFSLFKVPTGYGPSDHQSFYEVGVPVLFYFTGLHNDYHRPSDDFGKIDFGGLTRITDIVTESCRLIAISPDRPRYVETEKKFKMRWQKTAVLGVSLSDTENEWGTPMVFVSALKPGGPAINAGIREGDQLVQIGKDRVQRSGDVLSSLRGKRPGEKLEIRVLRDGNVIVIPVNLAERD
ncbi:M28 family peptidase [Rubripirellula obstinata]|nr:M28 family peptidase [Rubripirellula obstinata]